MELKGLLKKTDSKKCVKIFEFALKNVKIEQDVIFHSFRYSFVLCFLKNGEDIRLDCRKMILSSRNEQSD